MENDFRGTATDVIVFVRRVMKYTEGCKHIRGSTVLDDVSADVEADGTVTPTPVPLERDRGRANDPDR